MNNQEIELIKELLQNETKNIAKELDLMRQDNFDAHSEIKGNLEKIWTKISLLEDFRGKIYGATSIISIIFAALVSFLIIKLFK